MYITANKKTGGVKTFALALSAALSELGYECIVVESFGEMLNRATLKDLRQPNVILISSLGFGIFNLVARNSIFVLHGFPRLDDAGILDFTKVALATKLFSRWASRVTSISQLTYLANISFFGIRSHSIIGNPYLPSVNPYAEKDTVNHQVRILYVGRLVAVKRVEQLIRGFLLAVDRVPSLHLEIVGSGPQMNFLQQIGRHPNISFAGAVSNDLAKNMMRNSDIFVSLAEGENFGITFLEAIHAGCHIICPTTGGQIDWILDYPQVTYVRNVFDADAVCDAILKAVNALREPKKPFDPTWNRQIALRYDALIREAIGEKTKGFEPRQS
ncbi:MAG: glycosyltransferase family 4 protein [Meiothermus sp.]|nr:glycosyltransferase family 4 protein [Meiothermus sp.]